jgi:DNA-binding CsgD family transcriptional regulator
MIYPIVLLALSVLILMVALYVYMHRKHELQQLKVDFVAISLELKRVRQQKEELSSAFELVREELGVIKAKAAGIFPEPVKVKEKTTSPFLKQEKQTTKDSQESRENIDSTSENKPKRPAKSLQEILDAGSNMRLTALRGNMKKLISEIEVELRKQDSEKDFKVVGSEFITILTQKYPELSLNEIRICTYIRLGYSTKEIADFICIEVESVSKARNRLRKKLNIDRKMDIAEFLEEIIVI